MAFERAKYDNNGTGLGVAPKMATYRTTEDLADVKAADFFNEVSDGLETGDIIYVDAADGQEFFSVTVDKAAATVVLLAEVLFAVIT